MRFSAVAIASALVANAYAMGGYYGGYGYVNETVTTEVVTEYTTYCPYATVFTEGVHTYTVTEATTLTITNCPCTRTYTLSTVSPTYVAPSPVYTPVNTTYYAPPPVTTVPVYVAPTPSKNVTTTHAPVYASAAGRISMASGALAAVMVAAACLL